MKEFKFDFVAIFLAEVIENDISYYVIAAAVNSLALIVSVNRMSVIKYALAMDSHQELIRCFLKRKFSILCVCFINIILKGNWILKDLFFEKSKDELIYQALNASEMIDRL